MFHRVIGVLALIVCLPVTVTAQPVKKPEAWYPRTEKLAPDEMFVVALGTGMPTPITRAQKSTAWYVELGNGDIFLFDVGSGSMESLFALRPEFHKVRLNVRMLFVVGSALHGTGAQRTDQTIERGVGVKPVAQMQRQPTLPGAVRTGRPQDLE